MTDFAKLLGAYAATQFGDQVTQLALPLVAALLLGAGPAEMGWLTAASSAPFFLFGLPAGVWVDRLPRRTVIFVADFARAVVLLVVPIATVTGYLTLPLLAVVAVIAGTGAVFVDIASQSYVPTLVARERLIHANSRFEIGRAAATIGGPGLAGALSGLVGPGLAVVASALGSFAAAGLVGVIRTAEPPKEERAREPFAVALKAGMSFLLDEPRLRALALCACTWNISQFAMGAVLLLHAARNLGLSGTEIGLVFAVDGIGMTLGALAAPHIERRIGLGRSIVLGPIIGSAGILLVVLATPAVAIPMLVAGRLLFGFGPMVFSVIQTSLRQSVTPPALLGRVNASLRWLTWGLRPVGALLGGFAGEVFGLHAAVSLAGLGLALCLVPLAVSPVPRLERIQA